MSTWWVGALIYAPAITGTVCVCALTGLSCWLYPSVQSQPTAFRVSHLAACLIGCATLTGLVQDKDQLEARISQLEVRVCPYY